jgi:predicted lipid-binding transport protein (Tim44 family)
MSLSTFQSRSRFLALALSLGLAFTPALAEAKAGGGSSFGSRGAKTYSAPPVTNTAPRSAAPMERSAAPQTSPGSSFGSPAAARPGMFGGAFGRGLLGGLVGAGLIGMLFGHGLMGGLGDMMSIFGLLLQIALVVMIARFAWSWYQNRQRPAMAGMSPRQSFGAGGPPQGGGFGFGGAPPPAPATPAITPLKVEPVDFNAFEHRLVEIQAAYSAEDTNKLRSLATSEMANYFAEQFADNARKGVVNRIASPKLLQGDLSEAWREGPDEYATTAMRFSLIDTMVDRTTGKVVSGDPSASTETTELWTFQRPRGTGPDAWMLSAIQQA